MSGVYKSLYKRRLTTPILNAEFPLNIIQETKVSTPASDRNVNPALRRQQAVHSIGVYHMVISSYVCIHLFILNLCWKLSCHRQRCGYNWMGKITRRVKHHLVWFRDDIVILFVKLENYQIFCSIFAVFYFPSTRSNQLAAWWMLKKDCAM